MVNIAGRSKGCSTCRRRRVKCDETRPICTNCGIRGLACDGPREIAFVEAAIVSSRRKITTPEPTTTSQNVGPGSSLMIGPPHPPLIPDGQELCIMFARKHLDPQGPIDTALQDLLRRGTWHDHHHRSFDLSTCHLGAAKSFAVIFFGRQHNMHDITEKGMLNHGITLQHLQQAISRPDCWRYDEVLVTVTTLAVQETLVSTGPRNYMNHMLGLDKLLSLRDANAFNSPQSLSLYRCLRHLIVFASLSEGRASILARADWKAVLRRSCTTTREIMEQELYEVLADCSVLIAECNRLQRLSDQDTTEYEGQRRNVNQRANSLRARLGSWRAQWDADEHNRHAEIHTDLISVSSASTSYSNFVFADPCLAQLLMLNNIALIYVLGILTSTSSRLEASSNIEEGNRNLVRSAIREICQSMPIYAGENASTDMHSAPVAVWATHLVRQMLKDDTTVEGKDMMNMLVKKGADVLAPQL